MLGVAITCAANKDAAKNIISTGRARIAEIMSGIVADRSTKSFKRNFASSNAPGSVISNGSSILSPGPVAIRYVAYHQLRCMVAFRAHSEESVLHDGQSRLPRAGFRRSRLGSC